MELGIWVGKVVGVEESKFFLFVFIFKRSRSVRQKVSRWYLVISVTRHIHHVPSRVVKWHFVYCAGKC